MAAGYRPIEICFISTLCHIVIMNLTNTAIPHRDCSLRFIWREHLQPWRYLKKDFTFYVCIFTGIMIFQQRRGFARNLENAPRKSLR